MHLRDLTPRSRLGFHVSDWATGKDLILNEADPSPLAARRRLLPLAGRQFDLLFVDASDRDAA